MYTYWYNHQYYWLIRRTTEVQNKIIQLLKRESTDVITLDYLKVLAPTEEEKEYIQDVLQIRYENSQYYKWLYFQIVGQMPSVDSETFERPETYEEGIRKELTRQNIRIERVSYLYEELYEYRSTLIVVVRKEERAKELLEYITSLQ
ncbi:hypothetical protein [Bacillus sp. FJAT-45350]|uniref:hypothetical protein n=1 Tax=Bacillus sp. FJAT-45350 TaxID=2011014 RepID=UPI000BB6BC0B|nr:hypothetical protein [Bacillus sp. FJAT-45350]